MVIGLGQRNFFMESKRSKHSKNSNVVILVEEDSIAEELEIEVGDILISINDKEINDVFDYRYLINDEFLEIEIEKSSRGGERWVLEVEKDEYEDLGIVFESGLMDNQKSCTNKCIFCFIDQLPSGMRETLYFKDDDSRLSFLQGNYVTLTNMKEEDLERIIFYHLSPINVSVHTTNLELRKELLKNKNADKVVDYISKIVDAGIQLNFQIVLVPGVNDGKELEKTIEDLSKFMPNAESLSVVPVGVTKFRDGLCDIKPITKEYANDCIDIVEKWQNIFREKYGTAFAYISDEFYVVAEKDIPTYESYETFPQIENGVGMIASLEYDVEMALKENTFEFTKGKVGIVTGEISYNFIVGLVEKIKQKYKEIDIDVIKVENNFFGRTITVSGLLTGADIIGTIKQTNCNYDKIIIPKNCLRDGDIVFLDDLTIDDAEKQTGIDFVSINETDGFRFVQEVIEK